MLRAIIYTIICFVMAVAGSIAHGEPTPVVLVHGIWAGEKDMAVLEGRIKEAIPGTYVHSLNIGAGKWTSFWSMQRQGKWLCSEIQKDPKLKDGFIMICHSQGGLLGRYYLERWNNPKVITYISLATPQRGVFGLPGTYDERWKILNHFENLARCLLYMKFFQRHFSFAAYWNDSLHHDKYLRCCTFLPYLNNEIKHDFSEHYKANICSLKYMVLVGCMGDEIVEPLESEHFGFYKNGSKTQFEQVYFWDVYLNDTLGLKTLDDSNRLKLLFSTASHCEVNEDKVTFEQCILPYIKVPFVNLSTPATVASPK
jgi:palmitoyl-protein thioesterase